MAKQFSLTARDEDVLEMLTRNVGKLSLRQYERTWFGHLKHSRMAATNRLRALRRNDLVTVMQTTMHPEIPIKPLFTWTPGAPAPNAGRLSWKLRSRWNLSPNRTTIILPTKKAASLVGGFAVQPPRSRALLHDIHVTAIYLKIAKTRPSIADHWVHESALFHQGYGQNGVPLPDALLELKKPLAIDFGGSYSKEKIMRMHNAYTRSGRSLSYQIW